MENKYGKILSIIFKVDNYLCSERVKTIILKGLLRLWEKTHSVMPILWQKFLKMSRLHLNIFNFFFFLFHSISEFDLYNGHFCLFQF